MTEDSDEIQEYLKGIRNLNNGPLQAVSFGNEKAHCVSRRL